MLDLERLLWSIAIAPAVSLPPDAEACLECQHHPNHIKFEPVAGGQHCYMFKALPETLCMQFKKVSPK